METGTPLCRFEAFQVVPSSAQLEKDFLYIVASLNANSSDPTAADIVQVAKTNGVLPVAVNHYQEYPGRGMGGLVTLPDEKSARAALFGSLDFLDQCRMQTPDLLESTLRDWKADAQIRIFLAGWDGQVRGALKFKYI